ncbi:HYR domain-containing protein, partial [Bacteroidia bacterium]|nr:HYR domain-containing protein [Bacteroidia bacterium]
VLTQNVTVSLDASGAGSVTVADIDNGSTDNCTIATRTLSKSSFDCSEVGSNTIYLIITDVNGNIDSASAVITVQDVIKPTVVTAPSDIALGYCDAAYTYALPTGDDNCSVTVTQIAGLAPGSTFPVGLTVNIFEISDPSGNTVTTSFTVDIRARYMPFATPDISICNNNNKIDLTKGYDNIIFIGSGVESNEKFFNPNSLEPGIYSITAEYTDSMGCVSTEQFTIEIRSTPIIPIIKRVASDQIITLSEYNNYQWYRNGEELEGEDKQLLRVHELGIYSVLVGNDENCFEASEGYGFGIPVNEENVTNQGLVKVFPNPTRDMVFVQINDEVEFHLLTLSDAMSNKLIEQETSTKVVKLDLTSLAPGTYYLNILGGSTNETVPIVRF